MQPRAGRKPALTLYFEPPGAIAGFPLPALVFFREALRAANLVCPLTAVELRGFPAGDDDAMRQLRRSGLFVANGSHPAKSPVGASRSASMPLLRSFVLLPFATYKYAAPMGLGKARLALNSMAVVCLLPQKLSPNKMINIGGLDG